jgi:hypothetical protein
MHKGPLQKKVLEGTQIIVTVNQLKQAESSSSPRFIFISKIHLHAPMNDCLAVAVISFMDVC